MKNSNKSKCIKDPIYGYIRIPVDILKGIVDRPQFQRLRYVLQAGYTALFPSSTHNRFVHSLGVYYLGHCASKAIYCKLSKKNKNRFKGWLTIFEKACLLHDVGHAPFSHTGEDFYLDRVVMGKCNWNTPYMTLHEMLAHAITTKKTRRKKLLAEFTNIEMRGDAAKPHEIMSAIVGICDGLDVGLESDEQREFFARAICGYRYKLGDVTDSHEKGLRSFLSCLIDLLNSMVVDVDKLDYLLRDAYLLGFDTVRVDYRRLLVSIAVEPIKRGMDEYQVVYGKAAVSVLENVVYARDAERKWLQGHPIVLFDAYLLKEAIVAALKKHGLETKDVFCRECLSGLGKKLKGIPPIRYLCDADILYLMKSSDTELANLYLNRSEWYSPVWKSEFEYNSLFNGDKWSSDRIKGLFTELEDFQAFISEKMDGSAVIRKQTITECKLEIKEYARLVKENEQTENDERKRNLTEGAKYLKLHLGLLDIFKALSDKFRIKLDFALVRGCLFKSGFMKNHLDELHIRLHPESRPVAFGKVNNTLTSHVAFGDEMFYLFCKEKKGNASAMSEWLSSQLQIFTIKNEKVLEARLVSKEREKAQLEESLANNGLLTKSS